MINHYDIAYSLGLGISAPVWLSLPKARRKVLTALRNRMGDVEPRTPSHLAIMIHAVSLGEMNATRALVDLLRQADPRLQFIVSTTTETGLEAGRKLYGQAPDVTLIRYPLDFSSGVRRVLDRLKPALVVLMELEVWPNFLRQCAKRGIPVIVANGRMSASSYRNYSWIKPVIGRMLRRLTRICVQDERYAKNFIDLGAPPQKVLVTGTMKFDTAQVTDRVAGDQEIAEAVGLHPGAEPIWVCGSTGSGEEEIILRVYRELLVKFPNLRLVIVPRKPERFDEVASLVESMQFPLVRRSKPNANLSAGSTAAAILGDTMGELRKFYSLADVVFVGRSLVNLGSKQHGSDMIEPAALGKPVVVGPYTGNFADVMQRLRQAEAIRVVDSEIALKEVTSDLLSSAGVAAAMGRRAQEVVRREQGATQRHVAIIMQVLNGIELTAPPTISK